MPELPEVHTTATGLHSVLPGLRITDVWTSLSSTNKRNKGTVKEPAFFKKFRTRVRNAKVVRVRRRAKNILIELDTDETILIHMKMTGHLLFGTYKKQSSNLKSQNSKLEYWEPAVTEKNAALRDPFNGYIRFVFSLSNGKHVAFSDVRKFGKITLLPTESAETSVHLAGIGPEPLEKKFTEMSMVERLLKKPSGKIKQILMDQTVIAGIGNIYSDEMLWDSGIHPLSKPVKIPKTKMKDLYKAMQLVLKKGIDFGGDSTSDYRDINGKHGKFHHGHNAYQRTGEVCKKRGCKGKIKRIIVGGRSTHYCDTHQKLFV